MLTLVVVFFFYRCKSHSANLSSAMLGGVNLYRARLEAANLSSARLEAANLSSENWEDK